jgi:hypothetical protein
MKPLDARFRSNWGPTLALDSPVSSPCKSAGAEAQLPSDNLSMSKPIQAGSEELAVIVPPRFVMPWLATKTMTDETAKDDSASPKCDGALFGSFESNESVTGTVLKLGDGLRVIPDQPMNGTFRPLVEANQGPNEYLKEFSDQIREYSQTELSSMCTKISAASFLAPLTEMLPDDYYQAIARGNS